MSCSLSNTWLDFTFEPDSQLWSLYEKPGAATLRSPGIEQVRMGIAYRAGRERRSAPAPGYSIQVETQDLAVSPHGPLRMLQVKFAPGADGLRVTLQAALPVEQPFLLLRIELENQGLAPLLIDRITFFKTDLPQSHLPGLEGAQVDPVFFSNGWQSWNWTGAYGRQDRFRRTRLGLLTAPMRVNTGTPHPRLPGMFGSDLFAVLGDRAGRRGFLAGFLSQNQHFGSLEANIRGESPGLGMWANGDGARLDPGSRMETDWACLHFLHLDAPDPFELYLNASARETGARPTRAPSGWSSWYQFFNKVTAEDIRRNLQTLSELKALPLELVQIDDGFQAAVGDWLEFKPTFSQGVAPLAREIQEKGFIPGLWLAPFILDRQSRIARSHPEWLLRGKLNRPVNAGFIWDRFTTALDLTVPPALEHVREVIHTAARDWGYPYLKLDFLYAAALPGRYADPTRTRAQVLRLGLQAIREAAGEETFLLGCGCPLGPALGIVDAMRIGADVAPEWRPVYRGINFFFDAEPDYPAARNAIQNTLSRAPLHNRWWSNDPDALVLRPASGLTLTEVHSLATVIALTGGAPMLSDDLPQLTTERLEIARALLPPIAQRAHIPDLFDRSTPACLRLDLENAGGLWYLLALFNGSDQAVDLQLRLQEFGLPATGPWIGREFWSGRCFHLTAEGCTFAQVPAHGVIAAAVRPEAPGKPQYLGSSLHISQGLELAAWESRTGELLVRLERPGPVQGAVDLALPSPPATASLQGRDLAWDRSGEGLYRFPVSFEESAELKVTWG